MLLYGAVGSCYYVLDEDNYAVVTTLGSPQAVSQAGLHFKLPWIQRVTKVSKVIKGMPIGYIPETDQTINEEAITLEDVYEPYLLQQGFLTRTPRGRCVTRKAYEHLGLEFVGQQQLDM